MDTGRTSYTTYRFINAINVSTSILQVRISYLSPNITPAKAGPKRSVPQGSILGPPCNVLSAHAIISSLAITVLFVVLPRVDELSGRLNYSLK